MESIDLNIKNYDLEDILKLFNLEIDFTFQELKSAFKVVAKTHPDKSNLDAKYFMFFKKAYSVLLEIYKIRNKKNIHRDDFHSNEQELLCKKISKKEDFNSQFNRMFEETTESFFNKDNGYGDWMKNEKLTEEKINSMGEMGAYFEKKKKESRELVKHRGIQDLHSGYNNTFLSNNDEPEEYSSGIFSKLQFEDLKKAHSETVVPVTEEDFYNKQRFNSVDELKRQRGGQDTTPMSKVQANEYLQEKHKSQNHQDVRKMFDLIKQDEKAAQINREWWGKMRQLKN